MSGKRSILARLKKVYCRLQPSPLGGVGIFAIRDIPKGANPFFGTPRTKWVSLTRAELKTLPVAIRKLVTDFCVQDKPGVYLLPAGGPNCMDISFFLNFSKKPNVRPINGGDSFITIRKIKKGEELVSDYDDYDPYYKL